MYMICWPCYYQFQIHLDPYFPVELYPLSFSYKNKYIPNSAYTNACSSYIVNVTNFYIIIMVKCFSMYGLLVSTAAPHPRLPLCTVRRCQCSGKPTYLHTAPCQRGARIWPQVNCPLIACFTVAVPVTYQAVEWVLTDGWLPCHGQIADYQFDVCGYLQL